MAENWLDLGLPAEAWPTKLAEIQVQKAHFCNSFCGELPNWPKSEPQGEFGRTRECLLATMGPWLQSSMLWWCRCRLPAEGAVVRVQRQAGGGGKEGDE
jgi:hypothetical protein